MRNFFVLALLATPLLASGCSRGSFSSEMKAALYEMNELYFACKKAKKKELMGSVQNDIAKAHVNLKEIANRVAAIPADDSAARQREMEKYGIALKALYGRLHNESQRVQGWGNGATEMAAAVKTIYDGIIPAEIRAQITKPGEGGGGGRRPGGMRGGMPGAPPGMNPGN